MGLKDWLLKKSLEKARSNLRATLETLIPLTDASWEQTEKCISGGLWPLPKPHPNITVYQKKLLEDLTVWKGELPDREAVEFIGAQLQRAGAGAKMAVRHVVITEWPKHGKPTISETDMELILGSRAEDARLQERVKAYALHHLARERAAQELRDGDQIGGADLRTSLPDRTDRPGDGD